MEILVVFKVILISLISSGGLFINNIAKGFIESKVKNAETLEVRVYNVPTHSIAKGKVKKVRIASRGLEVVEDFRIEVLEMETDEIAIDTNQLKFKNLNSLRQNLKKPLQAGINLVITEEDLNKALQSSKIQTSLREIVGKRSNNRFEIVNISLNFLTNNRVKIDTKVKLLNKKEEDFLNATLEFGLEVEKGSNIKIIQPTGTLNGRQLSSKLLQGFADNFSEQLDSRTLEKFGVTLRLLQFTIDDRQIKMTTFVYIRQNNQK